ncbi:hypothetical protein CPS_4103 [Colwellia psychrerythraea 34H]|uniref:Uncharacterized protein n=1 Tax=Colwellia psychrerythraea (strain 34H / ATCC BAA-681) TaxID=167879 RepID=Q47WR4_COLP3|nr:hypothetical protein CPS_4103 [Colwellia psychrerythraea 34H]
MFRKCDYYVFLNSIMNVAGEILQHKNKKAPFIALFLTRYCISVCKLRQIALIRHRLALIKRC